MKGYWKQWERNRLRLEKRYQKAFKQVIDKQVLWFSGQVELYGRGAMINEHKFAANYLPVLQSLQKVTCSLYGQMVYRMLKRQKDLIGFGNGDKYAKQAEIQMMEHNVRLITWMAEETKRELIKRLAAGIEAGLGARELAKSIKDLISGGNTSYRAMRIARTETMRASNMGGMMGARDLPYEVSKVWSAAHDKRTRGRSNPNGKHNNDKYDHYKLDGVYADLEEYYQNGEKILFPGDPEAAAGNTINCRCSLGFVPKLDKDGNVIWKKPKLTVEQPNLTSEQIIERMI